MLDSGLLPHRAKRGPRGVVRHAERSSLTQREQQVIGRDRPALDTERSVAERAARDSLRSQIAHLEHELSAIVATRFPHISPTVPGEQAPAPARRRAPGPQLLSFAQLERTRDRLAGRLQELRHVAAERTEFERDARERLELMRLEPGRYKFERLPVADLGRGGCGYYEVRPRLGVIGMLAGWWELTLSSGCPLPRGPRRRRGPGNAASPRAPAADARSSSRPASSRTSGSGRGTCGSGCGPSGAGS